MARFISLASAYISSVSENSFLSASECLTRSTFPSERTFAPLDRATSVIGGISFIILEFISLIIFGSTADSTVESIVESICFLKRLTAGLILWVAVCPEELPLLLGFHSIHSGVELLFILFSITSSKPTTSLGSVGAISLGLALVNVSEGVSSGLSSDSTRPSFITLQDAGLEG